MRQKRCDISRQNTAMLSDTNEIWDVTRQKSAILSDKRWQKLSATLIAEKRDSGHVSRSTLLGGCESSEESFLVGQ